MGEKTGIAWTNHTFNPWWGCVKVSPACTNCYAETFDKRLGGGHWGPEGTRKFFGDKHWNEPLKWNAAAEKAGVRSRVFCASMADVFEDRPDLVDARARLWRLVEATPWLDWLLLTKRPENIERMLPRPLITADMAATTGGNIEPFFTNVWLGTTVESQDYEGRITHLVANPAVVHFLSIEPQLGRVDLSKRLTDGARFEGETLTVAFEKGVDWVIVGCESGHGARPMDLEWVRLLRDQCAAAGRAFFLKQAKAWDHGRDGLVSLGIGKGDGSWSKERGDLIELPYLDRVQHAAIPTPRGTFRR